MSIAALTCAVVDCADPPALAAFYLQVIDAEVLFEDETYSFIGHRGQVNIAFQRVDVADADQMQAAVDLAVERFGGLLIHRLDEGTGGRCSAPIVNGCRWNEITWEGNKRRFGGDGFTKHLPTATSFFPLCEPLREKFVDRRHMGSVGFHDFR
jgi:hypothetical protein